MTTTSKVRLHLFSETGTEGGWWSAQDHAFITPPADKAQDKHCQRCGRLWQDFEEKQEPEVSFTYYRDDWTEDGKNYMGGYFSSPVPIEGGQTWFRGEEPGSFNDEWTKRGNAASAECMEQGHDWKDYGPFESWSHEGLINLRSGDVLEVLDKDDESKIIETITVKLLSNGDQYAPGAKHARGMVIHEYPDPETIDFEKWNDYFFGDYNALLTRKEKS